MSETTTVVANVDAAISAEPQESQIENQVEGAEQVSAESAESKKTDFLAPKFAALTRKEKAIRQYEAQVKAKEAELQKRLAEIEGKSKEIEGSQKSFEEQFKANPLKALKERGITLEQLMEMQLNDENPTVDMKLERMKQELESKALSEVEQLKKMLKEKEEAEAQMKYEKAVEGYKNELANFVKANADTYELIVANNATDLMFEVAKEYYDSTGKTLEIEEVAKAVEAHLEEEAKKIFELKKFKQTSQKPEANSMKTAPTLSNTAAATVPQNGIKKLSNEESLREAAKLIRWQD